MLNEKLFNELRAISEERGYGDDHGISFKKWMTKDETKKRLYINITFGRKSIKYYIDMINGGIYYDSPRLSLEKEVLNRVLPVLIQYENELILKYI